MQTREMLFKNMHNAIMRYIEHTKKKPYIVFIKPYIEYELSKQELKNMSFIYNVGFVIKKDLHEDFMVLSEEDFKKWGKEL